jgi:pimeloyl-ACP methyl ester carboxylesterase
MRTQIAALSLLLFVAPLPQELQDKWFDSDGVKIRYVDRGAGPPVLLIHGYTRSVESNWIEPGVFADLVKDYRVIAFDLRGHGKSDKPHDPAKYGGEVVLDAIRLMDHLGIRRAHIVGYSLGAAITAKLVTTHPDRFVTATLGGHAGYRNWRPEFDESAKRIATELESDVPFRGLVVAMTPPDEPKRTEADIVERSAALAAVNDVRALAAYQRGGSREMNSTDDEVRAIKVPVLGIIGSLDNTKGMMQLQTLLPALKVVVIEGATHTGDRGAVKRPEFIAALRELLASHKVP